MKRFWLVLLSLGLVMAFSVSALAVDIKVAAEYYAGGLYLSQTDLENDEEYKQSGSTAFYFQRLRVGTDFIVSPGLKLVTRFDAMERIWGGNRSFLSYGAPEMSAETRLENNNIAVDVVYIDYTSPIGNFKVGYMPDYVWGTVWGNKGNGVTAGQIKYTTKIGNVIVGAVAAKEKDNSYNADAWWEYTTDRDYDAYRVFGIYPFKSGKVSGEVGLLLAYERDAQNKPGTPAYYGYYGNVSQKYVLDPYFKAKIGIVDIQGEARYITGKVKWESDFPYSPGYGPYGVGDVDLNMWDLFLDATADLGKFYVGGSLAYLTGDDQGTLDEKEGGSTGGLDWNPCLIMFNTETVGYWVGGIQSDGGVIGGEMSNALFVQGRVGAKPTAQTDVMLSLSYAKADEVSYAGQDKDYGWEVDLTGTYKITNNLSYMLGIGYLFTGDYYKDGDEDVDDDYMLINKLTLSF